MGKSDTDIWIIVGSVGKYDTVTWNSLRSRRDREEQTDTTNSEPKANMGDRATRENNANYQHNVIDLGQKQQASRLGLRHESVPYRSDSVD